MRILDQKLKPQNETDTHYMLKQIAAYYLHSQGYNRVAFEISVGENRHCDQRYRRKMITDVLGVTGITNRENLITMATRSVEAKASLSDFRNGYCMNADYNLVIAPKGIVPIKELLPECGLIEVDFDKVKIHAGGGYKTRIEGIETVKKPKRMDKVYYGNYGWGDSKSIHNLWLLEKMILQLSNYNLFYANSIGINE